MRQLEPHEVLGMSPAFPTEELSYRHGPDPIVETIPGMTLRQYAAIKIMAARSSVVPDKTYSWAATAEDAVQAADALLAELAK